MDLMAGRGGVANYFNLSPAIAMSRRKCGTPLNNSVSPPAFGEQAKHDGTTPSARWSWRGTERHQPVIGRRDNFLGECKGKPLPPWARCLPSEARELGRSCCACGCGPQRLLEGSGIGLSSRREPGGGTSAGRGLPAQRIDAAPMPIAIRTDGATYLFKGVPLILPAIT